jgi:hypothetical protein
LYKHLHSSKTEQTKTKINPDSASGLPRVVWEPWSTIMQRWQCSPYSRVVIKTGTILPCF